MKYKTTAKAIRNGYRKVIAIGYCDAQNLLRDRTPEAYAAGIYGWNFDVYRVQGVVICTGYRGMPGITPNYDRLMDLEKQAYDCTEEKREELLKTLIAETIK